MRASRILSRIALTIFGVALLLLVALLLVPEPIPGQLPPLPFDTNGYSATVYRSPFPTYLPPHAALKDRLVFAIFRLSQSFDPYRPNPTNITFAGISNSPCSIQMLLNGCSQASGIRYLMPPDVAAGLVQFSCSNGANGVQWIAATETALQSGSPNWWDFKTKSRKQERLVLIRYPQQQAVLVLPESAAVEFRRTNNTGVIDPGSL